MSVHYEAPEAWARGADPAYEVLSRAIVAASPVPIHGRRVIDLGAGTGATSRALIDAGARPIALDLSHAMLTHRRTERPMAVVSDICALPLDTGSAGGAVAAFSLSHVEHPGAVLSEAARVVADGGPVLAGVFAETGIRHPAKEIVETLASSRGWSPPTWYLHIKNTLEPRVADADQLAKLAKDAGLNDVDVLDQDVDPGLDTAEALVTWRVSGPGLAGFVAGLAPDVRNQLLADAVAAIGPGVQALRLTVRILSSVARASR